MDLARLRWLTRYTIALLELGSILAICSFIFFSNVDLDDKWTNIIATVVGGLLIQVGTMSKYIFSGESEHYEEELKNDSNSTAQRAKNIDP